MGAHVWVCMYVCALQIAIRNVSGDSHRHDQAWCRALSARFSVLHVKHMLHWRILKLIKQISEVHKYQSNSVFEYNIYDFIIIVTIFFQQTKKI